MQRGYEFRRALTQNPHGQGSGHRMRYGGVNMDQVEVPSSATAAILAARARSCIGGSVAAQVDGSITCSLTPSSARYGVPERWPMK